MTLTKSTSTPSKDNQSISKVFLQPLFGKPYAWTEKYLENIAQVEGFEWVIFTPHDLPSSANIRIVRMTLAGFNNLLHGKTGIKFDNVLENDIPKKNLTDYYPAYGHIFEDYIEGYNYWGHQNWDVVNGRLSHFLPDEELIKAQIWADEKNEVNGTFTLYKNIPAITKLYQLVPGWEKIFSDFKLYGFDEVEFSQFAVESGLLTTPTNYPYLSYDRFPQHIPKPQLEYKDGRLYELFTDTVTQRTIGKEIMWFHFSYTKAWPL